MFKKFNRRYIFAFMAIVFVSFSLLTLMLVSIVDNYAISMKHKLMENTAQSIDSSIGIAMRIGHMGFGHMVNSEQINQVYDILNRNAENTESVIFITDRNGRVIIKSDDPQGKIPDTIPVNILNVVYTGAWDEFDYSNLFGMFDRKHVNCIRPIYIMPPQNVGDVSEFDAPSEMLGAIFICSDSRNPILSSLGKTFALIIMWIFIVSILAIYFISERITYPLKEMSRAAKSFAQGRFDARVTVRGEDEIAELAIAFNNMAMSLEKMEENRNTFLSNVSHDLRTPMTTISGFIDGILTGAIPPSKQEHYLGIVSGEVKRLSRLVSSLLDITRLQAGEKKIVKAPFDICEMARQVLISCEDRIEEKELDVHFETDTDSMIAVADHDAIHQILYNLIDNAVKFSFEKGSLDVSIRQKDKKIFVSVKNTGDGIPKAELPYVFDQFYKSDKSRGLDKTGLGLGLYICKTIIDRHGEEIWVRSEEGSFCEFIFTLDVR